MKVIECSNKSLKKMFSVEDWTALNATKDNYEVLKLDHNQLENIDVAFPALRFPLKVIDFRHNKINKLVKNVFTNLNYLEEVNLAFNELTTENFKPEIFDGKYSPDEFEPLISLKRLYLSYNLLHNLDSEIFEHTKHLQELYLDNNPFQIIHTNVLNAFSDLPQLQKLDMSRMELSSLPEDTFHPLRALKVLKLEGNLFKTIPKALKFAINLKELSLDENPIGDLTENENFMPPMAKLEKLNMTYMGSMHVIGKGSMGGLESLKELRLSNNHHLSFIHPSAFTFPEKDNPERGQWPLVKKLFLDNNNLSSIDNLVFIRWKDMEELHIHDNPWLCDCQLEWVIEILMPIINKTTPHLIDHVKCAEPKPLLGQKLLDLSEDKSELRCLDKFGAHPERDSALLVALLIGVLLGIPLAFASIMIYKRVWGKQRGPADFSRAFYKRADMQDDVHI
jgi:Leucine-rich repeat (LRR) protein